LTWLPGYEDSRPVRVGNAAAEQFQLDVYGEVLNSAYLAMEAGLGRPDGPLQPFIASLLGFVVDHWHDPDEGIWEIRGPRRQFTHSKLMAWVAVDRAVKAAEAGYLPGGDVKEWRRTRAAIHEDICRRGYDAQLGSFTQYYGSGTVDASLLLMPVFGFLPPDDSRLVGTVEALGPDGFVLRYTTTESVDGLPPGENPFIFCSFWLVRALVAIGRVGEARELFDRLLDIRNDVGLLAEEYDPVLQRQIGNFPQAFSHLGLIVAALSLDRAGAQAGA
jgi:GH15 family glucan-1,4-alpha-glucosidase